MQGEATPEYIYYKKCAKRMKKVVPKAKLILLLRDPIQRAYSQYNMFKNEFDYHKSFNDAMYEIIQFDGDGIIERGFYNEQIKNLLKYFPKDQILILISEKFRKKPQETINQVFDFLNLKRVKIDYCPSIHVRKYEKEMDDGIKKYLYETFKPHNEDLYTFLGFRIEEWDY